MKIGDVFWVVEKTNMYSGNVSERTGFTDYDLATTYKNKKQIGNTNPNIRYLVKRAVWGESL